MRRICLALALILLFAAAQALAEEGADITKHCAISARRMNSTELRKLKDGRYTTYTSIVRDGVLTIDGKGRELGGIFLRIYERVTAYRVDAFDGTEWSECAVGTEHLTEWYPLPAGTKQARIVNTDKARLFIDELQVFGPGDKPRSAHSWARLDKADLMLITCHPDDELLWFGGLLPTYAGERGLRVQTVTVVPSTPQRRLELLDGLWHCGVTAYPVFLDMRDASTKSLSAQYTRWRRNTLYGRVTAAIRQYRPEVVVTHDLSGEYGHGGHRATADAVTRSLKLAADPGEFPTSAKTYGAWQVKKCYVHLYGKGELLLDWHQPLNAFDGRDGLRVATEALAFHKSQTAHGWAMEDGGRMDNALFGLYYSAVGDDETRTDLMEHIEIAAE